MATLTYGTRTMDGRKDLARFFRQLTHPIFEGVHVAWIREYQERGAVHYHVLWDETIFRPHAGITLHNMVNVKRKGKLCPIVTGLLEAIIVEAWIVATGDLSEEFIRFQWGGIVQPIIGKNGAAAYFGSYLAKAKQKTLPEGAEQSGRWWWICPQAKPVPKGDGFLTQWHLPYPISTIFDGESVLDYIVPNLPSFIPKWGDKPKFEWK